MIEQHDSTMCSLQEDAVPTLYTTDGSTSGFITDNQISRQEEETSSSQNQCWVIRMKPVTELLTDSDSISAPQCKKKLIKIDSKYKLEMTVTPYQVDSENQISGTGNSVQLVHSKTPSQTECDINSLSRSGIPEENNGKVAISHNLKISQIPAIQKNSQSMKFNGNGDKEISTEDSGRAELVSTILNTKGTSFLRFEDINFPLITNVQTGFQEANTIALSNPCNKIASQTSTQSGRKRKKLVPTSSENISSSIAVTPFQNNIFGQRNNSYNNNKSSISNPNENVNLMSINNIGSLNGISPSTTQVRIIEDHNVPGKRKVSVPRFMGDFVESDLECPSKRYLYWEITHKTIERLRRNNRAYSSRICKYQKQLARLRMQIKNQKFLNKFIKL